MDTQLVLPRAAQLSNTIENASRIFDLLDVSETTRQDYKYRIGLFLDFTKQKGISYSSYLEYKRYFSQRSDFTVATKNKYLTAAKVFLKELNRQGLLPIDITQNVKIFTQSKKHKKEGLNEEEVLRVTNHLLTLPQNPKNTRLKALFCLLALQGLRQIEIIRLDVRDLDLINKTAFIQGKGKDDKELIHLNPETVRALRLYMKENNIKDGALFKSLGNRKSARITTMTIKRNIKDLLTPLGIEKSVHGFRHFFVTTLLKKMDVRDVRKFSRHSSLEMLIVYDDEIDIAHKATEVFQAFNGISVTQ